ncbi:hypothetical protein, partial [Xanthomonas oryzae]|uniref:hypothetical protein n=1 Tax=Xanthomonas oryzae TaxID=347 RepID=UPI0005185F36
RFLPLEGEFNRRGGGAHAGARQAAPQRSDAVGASGMQCTVQMALYASGPVLHNLTRGAGSPWTHVHFLAVACHSQQGADAARNRQAFMRTLRLLCAVRVCALLAPMHIHRLLRRGGAHLS